MCFKFENKPVLIQNLMPAARLVRVSLRQERSHLEQLADGMIVLMSLDLRACSSLTVLYRLAVRKKDTIYTNRLGERKCLHAMICLFLEGHGVGTVHCRAMDEVILKWHCLASLQSAGGLRLSRPRNDAVAMRCHAAQCNAASCHSKNPPSLSPSCTVGYVVPRISHILRHCHNHSLLRNTR